MSNIEGLCESMKKIVIILILFISEFCLNSVLMKLSDSREEPPPERRQKFDPQIFQALSFGQLPVAIDWLWMNCLADPRISHVEAGTHPQIYYDLDLITDLDPPFMDVYTGGADLLAVIRNDGIGARDLLWKGDRFLKSTLPHLEQRFKNRYWNNAWQIPLLLAYVHLFELKDMPHAAQAFQEAARFETAPRYLSDLAMRLQRPGGEYDVGIKLLGFMISGAKEPKVRERLEKQRMDLSIGHYLFEMNLAYAQGKLSPSGLDPWGGELYLDSSGRVATTTPHEKVLGLQ